MQFRTIILFISTLRLLRKNLSAD